MTAFMQSLAAASQERVERDRAIAERDTLEEENARLRAITSRLEPFAQATASQASDFTTEVNPLKRRRPQEFNGSLTGLTEDIGEQFRVTEATTKKARPSCISKSLGLVRNTSLTCR